MRRFFTVVLVPGTTPISKIEETVAHLLAPYQRTKWDSWEIGGAWNRAIQVMRRGDVTAFPCSDQASPISENMLSVELLGHKLVCFALVTPDGTWHEKGTAGLWATVTDEKDEHEWHEEVTKIVRRYQDGILVGVTCHIS